MGLPHHGECEGSPGRADFFRINVKVPNHAGTAIIGGAYAGSEEYVPLLEFIVQDAIIALQVISDARVAPKPSSLEEAGVAESKSLFDRLDWRGTGSILKATRVSGRRSA